jgi:16S rRNA U1498 N3-methylase RsmE
MSKINQLRKAINDAIKQCLRTATPYVCSLAETKDGYEQLEAQIINLCINKTITPSEAITLIESENSNNE